MNLQPTVKQQHAFGELDLNAKARDAIMLPDMKEFSMHVIGVTPSIAAAWLQRNSGNRSFTAKKSKQYEEDMVRGTWKFAGDPIRFSKTGRLLDGQHTLTAIVNSGIKVKCAVMTGLDDEVFDVLGTGKPRSAADVLGIERLTGWQARTAATAIHWALNVRAKRPVYSGVKSTNQEVRSFLLENPKFVKSVEFIEKMPRHRPVIQHSHGLFLHWEFSKKSSELADAFFSALYMGEGLRKTSAVFHLRNRLLAFQLDDKLITIREEFIACIRAWNIERKSRSCTSHRNLFPRSEDDCPEIE
jgi:hypothetical protein